MKHLVKPTICLFLALTLSGCAVATAGVKKGDERNLVRSVKDINAGRVIEARMTRALDFKLKGVDVEVAEGIVLLSGNVPTQEDKIEAARIAWSARGIEQVGNEIQIRGKQSFLRNTKDGILEKAVRTRLTADRYVKARTFNIETHDGIVYVMGVARTQGELKRAAEIAATTRGAKQVISYARVANLSAQQPSVQQPSAQYPSAQYAPDEYSSDQYSSAGQTIPAPSTATPPAVPTQRALPSILQSAPSGPLPQVPSFQTQAPAPISNAPINEPIPFAGPTAPTELVMGDRLGKELPSDEDLGAFRTGQAGEAVSVIESAPYYLDPDTGKEIPIRFDADGNIVPLIVK